RASGAPRSRSNGRSRSSRCAPGRACLTASASGPPWPWCWCWWRTPTRCGRTCTCTRTDRRVIRRSRPRRRDRREGEGHAVMRWLKAYPLPLAVGGGLLAGLAARFVFGAPGAARVVFLAPLVVQTLRGIVRGRFAADIVAMLAILTALVLGEYFAGAVIALMQSGGEAL